ncbi:MAG: hypothetical protein CMF51_00780 [Legionellales bacterium]|nr:hypothetical protein [Legionellales bacterium]
MRKDNIYSAQAFESFWSKIEQGEQFALVRYGDGEQKIMQGVEVKAQEGWAAPAHLTRLSQALYESLQIKAPNFYHAITSPCCDQSTYYWYSSRIKNVENITFSNIFVNQNYLTFRNKFKQLKRDAVVIGNHQGLNRPIGHLNILKYYAVSDDCIDFWDTQAEDLIKQIKQDFDHNTQDLLFVVAAGPLSCPIITNLFQYNPHHCYIDFGSSIDCYIHDKVTRPYQDRNSKFSKHACWMMNPQTVNFEVAAVMNLYKRPEVLEQQLEALERQTLKPKKIMIFHDSVASGPFVNFPEHLKDRFDVIEVAKENVGVWGRFEFAQQAHTEYTCVFDDDTIPGDRWLESCHHHMMQSEGLYGANGVIMLDPAAYPKHIINVGWSMPHAQALEVDFVGQSWFFKTQWLKLLFQAPQSVQNLKICGEDMSFSYQLKKVLNIRTYVPPHPLKQLSVYGSLPEYAKSLGTSKVALSACSLNLKQFNTAMNLLLSEPGGWTTLLKEHGMSVRKGLMRYRWVKGLSAMIPSKVIRRSIRLKLARALILNA